MMDVIGIDLQQVSIATLIIALGLLVDDPVVAGDAIKRDLALGHSPRISAWLGSTKLATSILYVTLTNIVAYQELTIEERRRRGFGATYYRVGKLAIEHRWLTLLLSFVVLGVGAWIGSGLKLQFLPKDLSHLAYINI